MKLLLSRSCEYALQAVIYLAIDPNDDPVLLRDLSKTLDIPSPFLGKILQQLAHNGIISSQKGKGGGFSLNKSLDKMSLYDIVSVMDGADFLDQCILGFTDCSDENPCLIHNEWRKAKNILQIAFKEKSMADLKKRYIKTHQTGNTPEQRKHI